MSLDRLGVNVHDGRVVNVHGKAVHSSSHPGSTDAIATGVDAFIPVTTSAVVGISESMDLLAEPFTVTPITPLS